MIQASCSFKHCNVPLGPQYGKDNPVPEGSLVYYSFGKFIVASMGKTLQFWSSDAPYPFEPSAYPHTQGQFCQDFPKGAVITFTQVETELSTIDEIQI